MLVVCKYCVLPSQKIFFNWGEAQYLHTTGGRELQERLSRDLHAESGISINDYENTFKDAQKISECLMFD